MCFSSFPRIFRQKCTLAKVVPVYPEDCPKIYFLSYLETKISNFGSVRQTFLCRGIRFRRFNVAGLRWPNTVFARAFADAIQHVHKDFKKQTCRQWSDHFVYLTPALTVLFFSITERSVLMALVFYYKDMLE